MRRGTRRSGIRTAGRRAIALALCTAVLATSLLALAGSGSSAAADTDDPSVRPGMGDIFNGYVVGALSSASVGSPKEIFSALLPNDPFYDEPTLTGLEPNGTLLKAKPVDVMFLGIQPGNLDAWKVMYTTRGQHGQQVISTGILMIPVDGTPNHERPLIAYQEANDSVGAYCHPSTQWTGGDPLDGSLWSALGPLAQMFGGGAAVMISDVGNNGDPEPHGVFGGKFGGHALLDGIRAAIAVQDADLAERPEIGVFGIAGGGVGAAFAAEIAKKYAPELRIKGTVLEGMVVDLQSFFRTADGSIGSGFVFATLLGLEPWYPEWELDSQLNLAGRAIAKLFRTQCQTPAYFMLPLVPLDKLFKNGVNPADNPIFFKAFQENLLGSPSAKDPGRAAHPPRKKNRILISSCAKDDSPMSLVPAKDARDLAKRYRRAGAKVKYAPTDCSMKRFITDLYGWGTDLFGMQTIPWLFKQMRR
ncbi:lipase [Nocardioides sp. GY 10113]|uniref:lipase family protein n=1 Tax=Nocardioides sp. GY 10113 TaxID=2569761 RepID=UPI0010A7CDB6|nr:lipase family protein [Nocardioides sp. GY 10113]TIC88585.1 lipase [Nocardioides sp. GY 10113]